MGSPPDLRLPGLPDVTADPLPRPRPIGPAVRFEPAEGRLQGTLTLRVTVDGAAPIERVRFVEPAPLAAAHAVPAPSDGGRTVVLTADFPTAELADGPVDVQVEVVDVTGRHWTHAAHFTASNHGPAISWSAPEQLERVQGRLAVRAEALDPNGVRSLEAVDPAWVDTDPDPARVRFELDTAQWPDGRHPLRLRAHDLDGNRSESVRLVYVDNQPARILRGSAWAGGPISGARVRAYRVGAEAFDGLRVDECPEPGCETDGSGAFTLALADGVDGPLRIRVTADPGGRSAVSDPLEALAHPWPAEAAVSAVVPFAADDPVRIHTVTTLVDWTVTGLVRTGVDADEAVAVGRALWGEHACDHCDPMAVEPVGAGQHARLTGPVRLGLFHAGLVELAAWRTDNAVALDRPEAPDFWRLMVLLRRDLTDGVLDGTLRDGRAVGDAVDAQTLRRDLAAAIDRLIGRRDDWLDVPHGALRGEAGWLDALALRRSALWRAEPAPLPLDVTPPVLRIVSPAADSIHGPRAITLEVEGEDDGDPPTLHVVAPEGVVVREQQAAPGRLTALLDVTDVPEGPLTVEVVAEDAAGHLTEARVTVQVDHTRPVITLRELDGDAFRPGAVHFTRNPRFAFRVSIDDPDAELQVLHPADVRPFDGDFLVTLQGFAPGARWVKVQAIDRAGHESRTSFRLHREVDGPQIELLPLSFQSPGNEAREHVDCRRLPGMRPGPDVCDIELGQPLWGLDRHPEPGALLADDDREPLTVPLYPSVVDWPTPEQRIVVTDPTGPASLHARHRNADGSWSAWREVLLDEGEAALSLATPFATGRRDLSSLEEVELRSTDRVGNSTTLHLRWQRQLAALPLYVAPFHDPFEVHSPTAIGGYGFGPNDHPLSALTTQGTPEAEEGIELARWRVFNPWGSPIGVHFNGTIVAEYWRSSGYRLDRVMDEPRSPCREEAYYLGDAEGRLTDGCAASPWTLIPGGERWMGRSQQPDRYFTFQGGRRWAPLPEDGVVVPPGGYVDVSLRPALLEFELLPGHEVEVRDGNYLFHTVEQPRARLRMVRVERDSRLVWSHGRVNVLALPVGDPDGRMTRATMFPRRDFEQINPPLQLPEGEELR